MSGNVENDRISNGVSAVGGTLAEVEKNLSRWQEHELVWLWRRCLVGPERERPGRAGQGGVAMADAAALLGVRRTVYHRVEQGKSLAREVQLVIETIQEQGYAWPPRTKIGDRLALARRRARITLDYAAQLTGVTRPMYLGLEASGDDRVVSVFEGLGFTGI